MNKVLKSMALIFTILTAASLFANYSVDYYSSSTLIKVLAKHSLNFILSGFVCLLAADNLRLRGLK